MIKIKYNSNTGQILGNYPSSINYPSLTIDKDNKTITDQSGTFPYRNYKRTTRRRNG